MDRISDMQPAAPITVPSLCVLYDAVMGRLTPLDIVQVWLAAAFVAFLFTGVVKYSLIASVFAVTNFALLAHYLSLPPSDDGRNLAHFAKDLRVLAHRGAADDQPENTMAAFVYSAANGADAIELDVSLTSDGVPVCLHDNTLERTTNGSGAIRNTTWEEVRKLNAAAKFECKVTGKSDVGRTEPVPLLADVVQMAVDKRLRLIFDVKDCDDKTITALVELYKQHASLYRLAAVCSFFHSVTLEVKRRDARIMTGHTYRRNFYSYADIDGTQPRFADMPAMQMLAEAADYVNVWLINHWLWKFSGAELLLLEQRDVSKNALCVWHERGLLAVPWTVNGAEDKRHYLRSLKWPFMTDALHDVHALRHAPLADALGETTDEVRC